MDANGGFHELVSQSWSENNRNSSGTGVFECNICFDLAQDPIVTLCGHLFCWPCLYKWLQFHSYSHECPVCKSLIKEDNLVPIYGRGTSNSHSLSSKDEIPRRPASHRPQTAPAPDFFRQDGFMPMSTPTRSGAIPSLLNFQVHNTAANYGAAGGGIPYLFASYAHGGYAHGFHHYPVYGQRAKSLFLMICFVFLGLFVILLFILYSMFY